MPLNVTQEDYNALLDRVSKLEGRDTSIPHQHNGVDMYRVDESDLNNRARFVAYRALGPATAHTVAVVGGAFVWPFAGLLYLAAATVDTAGSTGTGTIDILKNGTSVMVTTKISLADGATDSRATGTTQPAITTVAFAAFDIITFSITAVQGTPALGLTVYMRGVQLTP